MPPSTTRQFPWSIRFLRAMPEGETLFWFLSWSPSQCTEQGALFIAHVMSRGHTLPPALPHWALDEWLGTADVEEMDPRQAALCACAQAEWYLRQGVESMEQVPRLLDTAYAACRFNRPRRRQVAIYRILLRRLARLDLSAHDRLLVSLLDDLCAGPVPDDERTRRWFALIQTIERDEEHLLETAHRIWSSVQQPWTSA